MDDWETSANEHIGSMAALPPLENVCGIASLSPAGKCLEAATAPICQTLCAMRQKKNQIFRNLIGTSNLFSDTFLCIHTGIINEN
jgi:hypothetical protein